MTPLEPTGPNAQQITYWNETVASRWIEQQERLDAQLDPFGLTVMERARIAAGERVLDVGCGCGSTSLELARRVGASGAVLGIDISSGMLDVARARADRAGVRNATFLAADAQTHRFEPARCDLLFSRFGVMFFADPTAAFANLRTALRRGGRLAFACWQALPKNPWMAVPMMAAAQYVEIPTPASPDAPGPFAFADGERVRAILEGAGFGEVALEALEQRLSVGGHRDLEEATEFLLQMGPAGAAMREADEASRRRITSAVRAALAPYLTPDGVVMDSAVWIATAVNP